MSSSDEMQAWFLGTFPVQAEASDRTVLIDEFKRKKKKFACFFSPHGHTTFSNKHRGTGEREKIVETKK
jgi:hypothetical protein